MSVAGAEKRKTTPSTQTRLWVMPLEGQFHLHECMKVSIGTQINFEIYPCILVNV